MKTYDWFRNEVAAVATPKFFRLHDDLGREIATVPHERLPTSYRRFLAEFGACRLFRSVGDTYLIGVLPAAEQREIRGHTYWQIGWYEDRTVVLEPRLEHATRECPVFELSHAYARLVARSFREWLRFRWQTARSRFDRRRWSSLCNGPEPFSQGEQEMIAARRRFGWRVVGMDDDCTLHIEITNGSDRRLHSIGISVRGIVSGLRLTLAVPVADVLPGQSSVITHRGLVPLRLGRHEIELYDDFDPAPEDREFRCEFRAIAPESQGAANEDR